jgi:hypothetical protein
MKHLVTKKLVTEGILYRGIFRSFCEQGIMILNRKFEVLALLLLFPLVLYSQATSQMGVIRGEVKDPTGAVVPGAQVVLAGRTHVHQTETRSDGRFLIRTLPGSYTLKVTAKGFAPVRTGIELSQGAVKEMSIPLEVAHDRETVTVVASVKSVSINPDQNSSAMVFRGKDLNALSDDPNQLQSELQQLAGAVAGPNGGEIYVDGFAGGRLPPKSSILEIRVNQNPFSSEYDKIGYGRVEIITKPGSQKLHGTLSAYGNSSDLNSANPMLSAQSEYYFYSYSGDLSGPLGKNASFMVSAYRLVKESQNIVNAVNPQDTSTRITQAVANPSSVMVVNPRIDVQAGKHTLSFRDYYYRSEENGAGVGALSLASQAISSKFQQNTFQFSDAFLVNPKFLNELHLEWRRAITSQTAASNAPTVIVSGAFIGGGALEGTVRDSQNIFELQNFGTATSGNHTLRFGMRLRGYVDANYSVAGGNGVYTFSTLNAYQAGMPAQYSGTIINDPVARVFMAEGSAFFQDDWRVRPNLMLGIGVRYEAQNWLRNHTDWAPRLALAWSPGRPATGGGKTVIRAGYGWFYDRFTVPSAFNSFGGAPYVIQTIHDNRVNQQSYVVNNPGFFNPNTPATKNQITLSPAAVPSYHTLDSNFKAALNMQAGVGIDRQFTKAFTANLTYLFTQGVHQYFSNNVTAPLFDTVTYSVVGPPPSIYNYQYQSGGFFRQQQIVATANIQTGQLIVNGSYAFNVAKSNTQGLESFVSVPQNPGFDYGTASFGVRHRFTVLQSYNAPFGFVVASLLTGQSGTPFNVTTGSDLTGNNQFNARPGYGVCGATGVIATKFGCLDPNPAGKAERIVPFGIGMGPRNLLLDLRVSKTFGIGPRMNVESAGSTLAGENGVGDRGLSGKGASILLNANAPRRFNLTFTVGASNVLNIVNWGTPNGVLGSPLFNQSQSLAGGAFVNPTPGNRAIVFQTNFSF